MKKQDLSNSFSLFKTEEVNEENYIKKNFINTYIKSPLNYTGGKYKLLPQIMRIFPDKIDTFIDFFCGGANVCVNVDANKIVAIDIENYLIRLYNLFLKYSYNEVIDRMEKIIAHYGLSNIYRNGKGQYITRDVRIQDFNREPFRKLKESYNNMEDCEERDFMFYVLVNYSFCNLISISDGKCTMGVGDREFNASCRQNLFNFQNGLKQRNIKFLNMSYKDYDLNTLNKDDFCYFDPPYLITQANYNKFWTEKDEYELLEFLDKINAKGVKFALSNVFESRGLKNEILINWSNKNGYNVYEMYMDYNNSISINRNEEQQTQEVLVTNY